MVKKHGDTYTLDTVDRGILYELQLDALYKYAITSDKRSI